MKNLVTGILLTCACFSAGDVTCGSAEAATYQYGRQYYSSWSYQPTRRYYVRRFYYRPTTTYTSYKYHYCVYYPRTYSNAPRYRRYVYFYNPVRRVYWGRFDLDGEPGKQYSLLKEEDRKGNLDDIPEDAFPKPGKMPVIPESSDKVQIKPLEKKDLPDESKLDDLPDAPKKP